MRKTLLTIIAIICITGVSSAQQIQFLQSSDKGSKKAYTAHLTHIAEAAKKDRFIVVEPELNFASITKRIKVRMCDIDWNEEKAIEIPDTKKNVIEKTFLNGDKLHLLLSYEDDDILKLRHIELNSTTLDTVSDSILTSKEFHSDESGWLCTASSPNGQLHCVVQVTNRKDNSPQAHAILFDNKMEPVWSQNLECGYIQQVIVTDRGEVVTATIGYTSENEDVSVLRFNIADANGTKTVQLLDKPTLLNIALLNYSDGKIVATSLEGSGARRFSINDYDYVIGEDDFSGVYAFCFDANTGRLVNSSTHTFTPDDIRVFENEDSSSRVGSVTKHISLVDKCTTPQGGAALYQRTWKLVTVSNRTGTNVTSVFRQGMLLFQVDMNGTITSTTPIRQNNQNTDGPKIGSEIFPYNGKIYLITNESSHETDEYTPKVPAKGSKNIIKANTGLSIYSITTDGQVEKQMLEKERDAILLSPVFKGSDSKFHFLSGGNRKNLSTIIIP